MDPVSNQRRIEPEVERDLDDRLTYNEYLCLDTLLSCQQPRSSRGHHDEMLFITAHQTTELWLKLLVHELSAAIRLLSTDDLAPALKTLARVKHIQRQMFEQWAVLETLTPIEYAKFRDDLGPASGFQSVQYRTVEFLLGNKNAEMLAVFAHDPLATQQLREVLNSPSLYDEFLRYLARQGHEVPADLLQRDFSEPHREHPGLVAVLKRIYEAPQDNWSAYETCEEFVDIEESFQLWRFRHMKTVERIIGHKRGTGGSSGVSFLKAALELTFFPEILTVRTEVGR